MSNEEFAIDPGIADLVTTFPRLFRGQPPAAWSDLPVGWADAARHLFSDLDAWLDDDVASHFTVLQIKEKFGSLRVYWELGRERTLVLDLLSAQGSQRMDPSPPHPTSMFARTRDRVRQAETQSAGTCQACGIDGASACGGRWIVTLCEPCRRLADLRDATS